jgi:hypothetical protein
MKRLALRSFLERLIIAAKEIKLTVFFSGERLLAESVTRREEIPPGLFSSISVSSVNERKTTIPPKEQRCRLFVHMNNVTPHNAARVASIMDRPHMLRPLRPPYSPDISPCDFW